MFVTVLYHFVSKTSYSDLADIFLNKLIQCESNNAKDLHHSTSPAVRHVAPQHRECIVTIDYCVILQLIYTVDKVFIFVVVVVIVVEVHAGIHGTGAEILRRQLQPNTHSSLLIIRDLSLIHI